MAFVHVGMWLVS